MHKEHHVTSSEIIRDVVIGMSDGLTVPFALAAGLSGAVSSSTLVVTAGIAEIVAGSIAMGLGGFLAGRTEVDHYNSELKREHDEVERCDGIVLASAYRTSEARAELLVIQYAELAAYVVGIACHAKGEWESLIARHASEREAMK